jgi:hypothetical protein
MGDRCWVQVTVRKEQEKQFCEVVDPSDSTEFISTEFINTTLLPVHNNPNND